MKYITRTILTIIFPFIFGCMTLEKKELQQNFTPPVLLDVANPSLVLDKNKANETAVALNWSAPVYGQFNAAVSYEIQLALSADFSNPVSVSVPDGQLFYNFTHQNIVGALITSLKSLPGMTTDIYLRLVSFIDKTIEKQYSNVIKVNVTLYDPYVRVFIALDGQNQKDARSIFAPNPTSNPDAFEGFIYFGANAGFKVYKSFNESPLGKDASASNKLAANGNSINITEEGVYRIVLNTATNMYAMTRTEWGII